MNPGTIGSIPSEWNWYGGAIKKKYTGVGVETIGAEVEDFVGLGPMLDQTMV
jgi:hypothetical protein